MLGRTVTSFDLQNLKLDVVIIFIGRKMFLFDLSFLLTSTISIFVYINVFLIKTVSYKEFEIITDN